MSDPMTNTEVEDVLSSIRRLVSDDMRSGTPAPESAHDRLVLTPSLRVKEEDSQNDAPEPQPPADDTPPISGQDDNVTDATEALDPDAPWGESVTAWAEQEDLLGAEKPEEKPHVSSEYDAFPFYRRSPASASPAPDALADRALVDTVDAVTNEAASSDDAALRDDVAAEASGVTHDAAEASGVTHNADDIPVTDEVHDEDKMAPDPSEAPATDQTLSDKIAALETLIARRGDQWEPDDTGSDAYAGTDAPAIAWEKSEPSASTEALTQNEPLKSAALEFEPETFSSGNPERKAEAETQSELEAEPQPMDEPRLSVRSEPELPVRDAPKPDGNSKPAADAGATFLAKDDDVLDEEALRELVADIVREELQGALGERITRNVRKLVRREIHRALAAQELD